VVATLTSLAAAGDDDGIRAELARVIPDADFPARSAQGKGTPAR